MNDKNNNSYSKEEINFEKLEKLIMKETIKIIMDQEYMNILKDKVERKKKELLKPIRLDNYFFFIVDNFNRLYIL